MSSRWTARARKAIDASQIDDAEARAISAFAALGVEQARLATRYDLEETTIRAIVKGRRWNTGDQA